MRVAEGVETTLFAKQVGAADGQRNRWQVQEFFIVKYKACPTGFTEGGCSSKLALKISPVTHRVSYGEVFSYLPRAMFKPGVMILLLAVLTVHVVQIAGEFCPLRF